MSDDQVRAQAGAHIFILSKTAIDYIYYKNVLV
jgi:hypothetical protein